MAALTLSACGARAASVSQAASPAATRTAATATTLTPPATTAAPALSSATPNPVSTQATVTSKCVTGIYDETSSVFYSMADLRRGATTGSDATEARCRPYRSLRTGWLPS
jgi:hypothetical protein